MKRAFGVLVGLLLFLPSGAFGAEVFCTGGGLGVSPSSEVQMMPFAEMIVDNESIDLSRCITPIGKMFSLSAGFSAKDGSGFVNALFNPDPFITFGATTTNSVVGPVLYGFLFGTPVTPDFYGSATSTGGVTVTNGASGTSSTTLGLIPTYISGIGTLGVSMTNLGVDLGTSACTAGPGTPFTVTNTCAQGTMTSSFPATFFDNLEAVLGYHQSDFASVASWSGAVTMDVATKVSEPTTLSLLSMGLFLVGALKFGRRQNCPRP